MMADEVIEDNDMEANIASLVQLGVDNAKGYKRSNSKSFSILQLKAMAGYLEIPKCLKKEELVLSIIRKFENRQRLADLQKQRGAREVEEKSDSSDSDAEDDEDSASASASGSKRGGGGRFIKNKHTFPRLCNCLMTMPLEVQVSGLQANRWQLQHRETGAGNPLFVEATEMFNNPEIHTGGLAVDQPEFFERRGINPECEIVGVLTAKKAYKLWKKVKKDYAEALKKYGVSGQANGLQFWLFCNGDVDVYYLHCILKIKNLPELTSYCAEGSEIFGGIETSSSTTSSTAQGKEKTPGSGETKEQKKARDKALLSIADSLQQKAGAVRAASTGAQEVQAALLEKTRLETLNATFEAMNKWAKEIEDMESAAGYDEENPSKRLRITRVEFDRVEAKYNELNAPRSAFTTPR